MFLHEPSSYPETYIITSPRLTCPSLYLPIDFNIFGQSVLAIEFSQTLKLTASLVGVDTSSLKRTLSGYRSYEVSCGSRHSAYRPTIRGVTQLV